MEVVFDEEMKERTLGCGGSSSLGAEVAGAEGAYCEDPGEKQKLQHRARSTVRVRLVRVKFESSSNQMSSQISSPLRVKFESNFNSNVESTANQVRFKFESSSSQMSIQI